MTNYNDVKQFHNKFDIPRKDKPGFLDKEAMEFRIRFIQEELNELKIANREENLEDAFDALMDIIWVAYGTADMMGISEEIWQEGWTEVVRANMSKERAENSDDPRSKRKNSLDIVKPKGWKGPNIKEVLEKHA